MDLSLVNGLKVGLVLLGFEEAVPDLLLLIPVHLGAYVAQLVLGDIK